MSTPEDDTIILSEENAKALEVHEDADHATAIIEHLIVASQREADVSLYHHHTQTTLLTMLQHTKK